MKQALCLFSIFLCIISISLKAQIFTIASYNLRFDNMRDTGNIWENRVSVVTNLIRFHDFDAFGTQEGLPNQLMDIANALPQYARYGKGRDDGGDKGEHSAIFYKKIKFQLLASGDFWLSETPGKPGLGWDATCCNRICSWVFLKDKTSGKEFYFFNVHFDHQGKIARTESSKLILSKVQSITNGKAVVLTGDFNADRNSEPYKIIAQSGLLRDSYFDVKYPYANNSSFNGFGKSINGFEVIDHIFLSKKFFATKWGILTDSYFGKFPSDHFPVEAVVNLK